MESGCARPLRLAEIDKKERQRPPPLLRYTERGGSWNRSIRQKERENKVVSMAAASANASITSSDAIVSVQSVEEEEDYDDGEDEDNQQEEEERKDVMPGRRGMLLMI